MEKGFLPWVFLLIQLSLWHPLLALSPSFKSCGFSSSFSSLGHSGLLGGARGGSPHPFLSLADPQEMLISSSTSESSRGRVLMLIQAAATAGSAADSTNRYRTSPTQGLTFLGDYPVLTCTCEVSCLAPIRKAWFSLFLLNISPCCVLACPTILGYYCITFKSLIDSEMALSITSRRGTLLA